MNQPVILHTAWSSVADDLADELTEYGIETRRAETPAESRELLADAEVAITGRLPEELLETAPNLEWVQAMSSGVDYFPLAELETREIALTNAAGIHAQPIAEQVLGYMIAFERNFHESFHNKQRGVWERVRGGELGDKTVGIIGLGAIGCRVAEFASALGMTVVGTKRDPSTAPEVVDEAYGSDGLVEVLQVSDYLVLACPLTDETRELIGMPELRLLGSDAVLVNIARGGVVDEDALISALQNRTIRGAALDVFDEEPLPRDSLLWDLSNVIVTPHMAGSTPHYAERLADLFVDHHEGYRAEGIAGLGERVL